MIEDLINQGHIIGNHSYTHESFDNLNINSCINEIDKCHKIIKKELGITTKYFAYPLGPPKDIIKRKEINIHLKSLKYLCSFGIETTNSIEIDYEFSRLDAGFQFVNLMNHE